MEYISKLPDRYIKIIFSGEIIKYKIVRARQILTLDISLNESLDKDEIELLASELLSVSFTNSILDSNYGWISTECLYNSPILLITYEYDCILQQLIRKKLESLKEPQIIILEEWD
jgi:hypothetical protein